MTVTCLSKWRGKGSRSSSHRATTAPRYCFWLRSINRMPMLSISVSCQLICLGPEAMCFLTSLKSLSTLISWASNRTWRPLRKR